MLTAGAALPARDEALARVELWSREVLDAISEPADRRLVQAYLTWQVLQRLRRRSRTSPGARTVTSGARHQVLAVVAFLAWLRQHGLTPATCGQGDVETWLATGPAAYDIRDFLAWAAARKHCPVLQVPGPQRRTGTATDPGQRWELIHRLLRDTTLDLTDRAAGCLLLLFGQHLSRTAVMTTDQITTRDGQVLVRFGQHEVPVPDSLAQILTDLIRTGRSHTGTGSPITSPWLFPGGMPGQPITPSQLGERLRALGIRALPGRRAALIDLAAQLPAAVLADCLNLSPGTAVRWMHQAGADWNRYAAGIARSRDHQPVASTTRRPPKPRPIRRVGTLLSTSSRDPDMPITDVQWVLGHASLTSTQVYVVYPEKAIRGHRAFITHRRQLRPSEEYRTPTDTEWDEFLGHFERRRVALGDCGRAYSTSCIHEHSCIRCPLLRISPDQRGRLEEIRDNLLARIAEAGREGWTGEAEGLKISLAAANNKLAQADMSACQSASVRSTGVSWPLVISRM
jgi:site-specific recombinase XerC